MPQLRRFVPDGGIVAVYNGNADIPAKRLLTYDTADGELGVQLPAAATNKSRGLSTEILVSGRMGDAQVRGQGICTAGSGGVAIGDRITSDTSGKGIVTTTEDNTVWGEARTAADADEDFQIELFEGAHVP